MRREVWPLRDRGCRWMRAGAERGCVWGDSLQQQGLAALARQVVRTACAHRLLARPCATARATAATCHCCMPAHTYASAPQNLGCGTDPGSSAICHLLHSTVVAVSTPRRRQPCGITQDPPCCLLHAQGAASCQQNRCGCCLLLPQQRPSLPHSDPPSGGLSDCAHGWPVAGRVRAPSSCAGLLQPFLNNQTTSIHHPRSAVGKSSCTHARPTGPQGHPSSVAAEVVTAACCMSPSPYHCRERCHDDDDDGKGGPLSSSSGRRL